MTTMYVVRSLFNELSKVTSRVVVEFLDTVRVGCFSLGGGEFGEDHRLVDDLDGVVHGGQLEH